MQSRQQVVWRRVGLLFQAGNTACQALIGHRFEQIVGGGLFKSLNRVVVKSGDEDNATARGSRTRCFQPALTRHTNVEKREIGFDLGKCRGRSDAIVHDGDDFQFGPQARQATLQVVGQMLFVFGNDGFHGGTLK